MFSVLLLFSVALISGKKPESDSEVSESESDSSLKSSEKMTKPLNTGTRTKHDSPLGGIKNKEFLTKCLKQF